MGKISLKNIDSIQPDEDNTLSLGTDLDVIQLQREFATMVTTVENLHKEIELLKEGMAQMVAREKVLVNSFRPICSAQSPPASSASPRHWQAAAPDCSDSAMTHLLSSI
jgi:hypothetical protein